LFRKHIHPKINGEWGMGNWEWGMGNWELVGAGLFNLSALFKAVGEPAPTGF